MHDILNTNTLFKSHAKALLTLLQSILHPDRNATWVILKDVLLEPYFMLYGEVYAGTIDRKKILL